MAPGKPTTYLALYGTSPCPYSQSLKMGHRLPCLHLGLFKSTCYCQKEYCARYFPERMRGMRKAWTHMDADSRFLRLLDGTPGELLGVECRGAPLRAKRVASLGDMVSGTMSDLPAGEASNPDLALLRAGLAALKPGLACNHGTP